jgi:hypothetical protein
MALTTLSKPIKYGFIPYLMISAYILYLKLAIPDFAQIEAD